MPSQGSNWGPLWDEAAAKYKEERAKYAGEHTSWVSRHIKKKTKDGKTVELDFQDLKTSDDFAAAFDEEIKKRRAEFSQMRGVGSGVADAMLALSTPLKALMDQASSIGGMFFPGTPMIYSGVVYLFDACKGVAGYFDVIEQLMTECHKFINNIAIHINSRKGVRTELKDTVIRCLVSFLNICRITTTAAKEKKLKAWFEQLYKDKGGEAKAALQDLEDLAKERDSTVSALTLRSVDNIENDVVEVKSSVIELKSSMGDVKSMSKNQTQIMLQILRQTSTDEKDSRTKSGASKESKKEHRVRDELRRFLNPDIRTTDRLIEIKQSTAMGTCDWILHRPEYEAFLSESGTHVLCIIGDSGVGKSHLAASIIRDLEDQMLTGENGAFKPACASFFCEFEAANDFHGGQVKEAEDDTPDDAPNADSASDSGSSGTDSGYDDDAFESGSSDSEDDEDDPVLKLPVAEVLKTLAWDLTERERTYESHLTQRQSSMKTSTIQELWESLFDNGYFTRRPCFMVIDGLETVTKEERELLYSCLKGLPLSKDGSALNIKVVLLGRSDIKEELEASFGESLKIITVTGQDNQNDMKQFVLQSLRGASKFAKVLKKNVQLADNFMEKILEASWGNFEMTSLLVREILQKDHLNVLMTAVDRKYRLVDEVLRETLQHFGQTHEMQDIEDLNRLLAWTLCAQRPMTLAELNIITATESKYGAFLDIREKIRNTFSSYFSIVDKSQKTRAYQRKFGVGVDADSFSDAGAQEDDSDDSATLKLAHSSIAAYFRRSEKVEIDGKGLSIGVNQQEAHLRIIRTCLTILCDTTPTLSPLAGPPDSVLQYASYQLIDHLKFLLQENIMESLSLEDKVSLVKQVIKLFRDDTVLGRWWFLSFGSQWPHWYSPTGPLQYIWRIISDDIDIRAFLQPDDRLWIEDKETTIFQKLLKRPAMFVAASWFGQLSPSDVKSTYFYHLEAMINIMKLSVEELSAGPSDPPYSKKWKFIPRDRILAVAEWAGFEKTPVWYVQVASMLKSKEGAIDLYNEALALSPDFGAAHYGFAIKHGDLAEYEQAIHEMKEAERLGIFEGDNRQDEDDDEIADENSVTWIAYWQKQWGNPEEGLRTLEEGLKGKPNNFSILFDFLESAFELKRYSQIMARLRSLDSESLSKFLNYDYGVNDYVRKAAQQAKRTDFLKGATIAAIEQAQKDHCDDDDIVWFKLDLASLYAENQEEDKAIEQLREVYELDQVSRQPSSGAQYCGGCLAELYYDKACAVRRGSPEYESCVTELREMEKLEHSPFGGGLSTDKYDAGLFLGLLLRQEGKEKEARPFFRDRICLGLGLLEDDDLDNDVDAWAVLSAALCKSGDLINGEAAVVNWAQEENSAYDDDSDDDDDDDDDEDEGDDKNDNEGKGNNSKKAKKERDQEDTEEQIDNSGSDSESDDSHSEDGNIDDDKDDTDGNDDDEEDNDTSNKDAGDPETTSEAGNKPVQNAESAIPEGPSGITATALTATEPTFDLQHTTSSFTSCQGPCNADFEDNPKKAYICIICYYTAFCEDCLPLLESSALPYKKCDPSHTRFPIRFPPKDLPEGKIIVDGKVRDLKEWKNEIRKNWGLPELDYGAAEVKEEGDAGDKEGAS